MLHADLHGAAAAGALELDVALAVAPGECVALTGPSGAGKTTVLRGVAGLARPRRGAVSCGGERWLDIGAGIDLPPERRRVGLVFQDHALFPHLSAWRNVAYALGDRPRRERRVEAHGLLERVGLLGRADARPRELSGGERQRVALARALARRPLALLLDEPLSALDARARAAASALLATAIRDAGVPAVLVTHDFTEAAQLARRVAVLDRGAIVQEDTPARLAAAPASGLVADLTGAIVLAGTARGSHVTIAGGATIATVDEATGPVSVVVHPWDVALEPPGAPPTGSARNRLRATVTTVTPLGGRVRVGLDAGVALSAEITPDAAAAMGLAPGSPVVAVWKAAATRVVPREDAT